MLCINAPILHPPTHHHDAIAANGGDNTTHYYVGFLPTWGSGMGGNACVASTDMVPSTGWGVGCVVNDSRIGTVTHPVCCHEPSTMGDVATTPSRHVANGPVCAHTPHHIMTIMCIIRVLIVLPMPPTTHAKSCVVGWGAHTSPFSNLHRCHTTFTHPAHPIPAIRATHAPPFIHNDRHMAVWGLARPRNATRYMSPPHTCYRIVACDTLWMTRSLLYTDGSGSSDDRTTAVPGVFNAL